MWLADHWLSVWLIGMAIIYLPGLKIGAIAARNSKEEHFDTEEVLMMMFWVAVFTALWPLAAVLACVAIVCLPIFGIGYLVINSGGIRKKLTRAS